MKFSLCLARMLTWIVKLLTLIMSSFILVIIRLVQLIRFSAFEIWFLLVSSKHPVPNKSPVSIQYTTFINGGHSGGMVTINIKARLERPCAIIIMAAIPSTSTNVSVLTEDDIPGASLAGRKPSELKNEELKFWLRCRGDPGKGLKTSYLWIWNNWKISVPFAKSN